MSSRARTSSNTARHADPEHTALAVARALRAEERRLAREQTTPGIDARDELQIHPLVLRALHQPPHAPAFREVRYPSAPRRGSRAEGLRCDIAITTGPPPADDADPANLFTASACPPEDTTWIEVKLVNQHALFDGCARPNPQYSAELLTALTGDAHKLAADPAIVDALLCAILFHEDEHTAEHDLRAWYRRAVERAAPVSFPATQRFPIRDLIGNAVCTVAVARVHTL